MSRFVAVLCDAKLEIHLPHNKGTYATLCGLDGDDFDSLKTPGSVDQRPAKVPHGARVDCAECRHIWEFCRQFCTLDFVKSNASYTSDRAKSLIK